MLRRPAGEEHAAPALRATARRINAAQVAGHVFDPAHPDRRYVVELLLDGYPSAVARADLYDHDLARESDGDGCHGFVFTIPPLALNMAHRIEIRLANRG
jgi:hypothetical protein